MPLEYCAYCKCEEDVGSRTALLVGSANSTVAAEPTIGILSCRLECRAMGKWFLTWQKRFAQEFETRNCWFFVLTRFASELLAGKFSV